MSMLLGRLWPDSQCLSSHLSMLLDAHISLLDAHLGSLNHAKPCSYQVVSSGLKPVHFASLGTQKPLYEQGFILLPPPDIRSLAEDMSMLI